MSNPISAVLIECLQLYNNLLVREEISALEAEVPKTLWQDELGRLRVWAANIGAHQTGQSSLDYRLRDASHIKDQVIKLLSSLCRTLQELEELLAGPQQPLTDDSSDEGDDTTEAQKIYDGVVEIITCLLQLSMQIRRPADHDRLLGTRKEDVASFEPYDKRHVVEKFPQTNDEVATRLGAAISRRRAALKYRERHHAKLGQGISRATEVVEAAGVRTGEQASTILSDTVATEFHEPNTEPNIEFDDTASTSGISQTSYAQSILEGSDGIKIPPPPKESSDGKPFECPYCYFVITIDSRRSWARHLFRDIMPYSCTLPDCSSPQRLYASRREWYQHLREDHSFFATQAKVMCPLCPSPSLPHGQIERHLGRHLEELALFAVPRPERADDGEASEELSDAEDSDSFSHPDNEVNTIKCVCEYTDDDGHTVFCEKCETWQHMLCYYPDSTVPEVHHCFDCQRSLHAQSATERQRRLREQADNDYQELKRSVEEGQGCTGPDQLRSHSGSSNVCTVCADTVADGKLALKCYVCLVIRCSQCCLRRNSCDTVKHQQGYVSMPDLIPYQDQRFNQSQMKKMICDHCNVEITQETHYHCLICNDGDYDLCQQCYSTGARCKDNTHSLRSIYVVSRHPHTCLKSRCGKVFASQEYLRLHQQTRHSELEPSAASQTRTARGGEDLRSNQISGVPSQSVDEEQGLTLQSPQGLVIGEQQEATAELDQKHVSTEDPWLTSEDYRLLEVVGALGTKDWKRVSVQMQHRSEQECRKRFYQIDPTLRNETLESTTEEMAHFERMIVPEADVHDPRNQDLHERQTDSKSDLDRDTMSFPSRIDKATPMLYGIVQHDFKAERPDELDAKAGEAIIIVAQLSPEWVVVKPIQRLGGPGLIPLSFIELKAMSTGAPVTVAQDAITKLGVPSVAEWKKRAAEYRSSSVMSGKIDSTQRQMASDTAELKTPNSGEETQDLFSVSGGAGEEHLVGKRAPAPTGRALLYDESVVLDKFFSHYNTCRDCNISPGKHLGHGPFSLCKRGTRYARDVCGYMYSKNGKIYSSIRHHGVHENLEVVLPADFDAVKELLSAVERGWKGDPYVGTSSQYHGNTRGPEIFENVAHFSPIPPLLSNSGYNYGAHRYSVPQSHPERQDAPDIVIIRHKQRSYELKFQPLTLADGVVKVQDVRECAAEILKCEPGRLRMLYKGRILDDDRQEAKAYDLKVQSEIVCVVSDADGTNSEHSSEDRQSVHVNDLDVETPERAEKSRGTAGEEERSEKDDEDGQESEYGNLTTSNTQPTASKPTGSRDVDPIVGRQPLSVGMDERRELIAGFENPKTIASPMPPSSTDIQPQLSDIAYKQEEVLESDDEKIELVSANIRTKSFSQLSQERQRPLKTKCLTCRKRRIKCGEERPVCNNCVESGRDCEGYGGPIKFSTPEARQPQESRRENAPASGHVADNVPGEAAVELDADQETSALDFVPSVGAEEDAYVNAQKVMFGAEMRAQNKMQTQTTEAEFEQKMNDAAWKTASSAASDKIQ